MLYNLGARFFLMQTTAALTANESGLINVFAFRCFVIQKVKLKSY